MACIETDDILYDYDHKFAVSVQIWVCSIRELQRNTNGTSSFISIFIVPWVIFFHSSFRLALIFPFKVNLMGECGVTRE